MSRLYLSWLLIPLLHKVQIAALATVMSFWILCQLRVRIPVCLFFTSISHLPSCLLFNLTWSLVRSWTFNMNGKCRPHASPCLYWLSALHILAESAPAFDVLLSLIQYKWRFSSFCLFSPRVSVWQQKSCLFRSDADANFAVAATSVKEERRKINSSV